MKAFHVHQPLPRHTWSLSRKLVCRPTSILRKWCSSAALYQGIAAGAYAPLFPTLGFGSELKLHYQGGGVVSDRHEYVKPVLFLRGFRVVLTDVCAIGVVPWVYEPSPMFIFPLPFHKANRRWRYRITTPFLWAISSFLVSYTGPQYLEYQRLSWRRSC